MTICFGSQTRTMSRVYYNPNPVKNDGAGDCAVRAIAKALDVSWEKAYAMLSLTGFLLGDMPSSDVVWSRILKDSGFSREIVPNTCPDCYTVKDFCEDYPIGVYVVKTDGHVATVVDGNLYDSWDSSLSVPIYFWHK